ncbi:MAG: L,D-transpeptidase [Verrucomicrobiota bacterium]
MKRIQVNVAKQELSLVEGEELVAQYPISTSKFGLGTEEGSYRTPLGRFQVCECHGDDAPERTIFRSRKAEGTWEPATEEETTGDLVLSRILWLDGMDDDNGNSRERYIYIHGTNHEDDIGTPASMGCVRMKNADVVALYDQVGVGTKVEIVKA